MTVSELTILIWKNWLRQTKEYLIQREKNILQMYGRTEFRFYQKTVIVAKSVWQCRNSRSLNEIIDWDKRKYTRSNEKKNSTDVREDRIPILSKNSDCCIKCMTVSELPILKWNNWLRQTKEYLIQRDKNILLMSGRTEFRFCQRTVIVA